MCGNGKEGKWRKKEPIGGISAKTTHKVVFHIGMCTHMSACMAWKPRQIVHLNYFYKGDLIKMSMGRALIEHWYSKLLYKRFLTTFGDGILNRHLASVCDRGVLPT